MVNYAGVNRTARIARCSLAHNRLGKSPDAYLEPARASPEPVTGRFRPYSVATATTLTPGPLVAKHYAASMTPAMAYKNAYIMTQCSFIASKGIAMKARPPKRSRPASLPAV